jgi:RES domain
MSHFTSWQDYEIFSRSVRTRNRYVRTAEETRFLDALRFEVKDRILPLPAGWEFWRAQRGYCIGSTELDVGDRIEKTPSARPYSAERMKPRPTQALEGRVNPKGIPCLYGGNSPDTAVAEVRPWKGELVSVGKFSLCRSVKMIEFLTYHDENRHSVLVNMSYRLVKSDAGEIIGGVPELASNEDVTKNVWTHIDQAFSEPVTHSDDHSDYVPTQILAECLNKEGYDGICYRSKLSDQGINVAFFDPEVATITSRSLFEVVGVKIESRRHEDRGIDFYSGKPITG